jgi:hypothetical protein
MLDCLGLPSAPLIARALHGRVIDQLGLFDQPGFAILPVTLRAE